MTSRRTFLVGATATAGSVAAAMSGIAFALPAAKLSEVTAASEVAIPGLKAYAVGQDAEFNWQVIEAVSEYDAKLTWITKQRIGYDGIPGNGYLACTKQMRGNECLCEHCLMMESINVQRREAWDGKQVKTGGAEWYQGGYGTLCSRCSYETYQDGDNGKVIDAKIVCGECLTIEDWEKIDPEYAAELRGDDT